MRKRTRKGSALCSNFENFPWFLCWVASASTLVVLVSSTSFGSFGATYCSLFIVFESSAVAGLLLTNHIRITYMPCRLSAFILLLVFLNKVMKCARTKSGLSTNLQDTLLFRCTLQQHLFAYCLRFCSTDAHTHPNASYFICRCTYVFRHRLVCLFHFNYVLWETIASLWMLLRHSPFAWVLHFREYYKYNDSKLKRRRRGQQQKKEIKELKLNINWKKQQQKQTINKRRERGKERERESEKKCEDKSSSSK